MLQETIKLMKRLREVGRFRNIEYGNNQKISDWVDSYLDKNRIENKPIVIITPWSLSKGFEKRYREQGNAFLPTREEISLFTKEIPEIHSLFEEQGFIIDWWIVFSRSYIPSRVISKELENSYTEMVTNIARDANSKVVFANWEDDVLLGKHIPNSEVLIEKNFQNLVKNETFQREVKKWEQWAFNDTDLVITGDELISQTKHQIACEAEEGRYLMQENNSLCAPAEFLFMPLGSPERYSYFSLIASEFWKRLVFVLPRYPWRNYNSKKEVQQFDANSERQKINGMIDEYMSNKFKTHEKW